MIFTIRRLGFAFYVTLISAIKAWKTRGELAPKIGKGKYVLAEYEKLKKDYNAIRRWPYSLCYYRSGSR